MFLNAPEPIVVELKRRSTTWTDSINSSTTSSSKSSCETASVKHQQQTTTVMTTTTAVQTDPINYHLSPLVHDGNNSEAGYAMQEFLYDESPTSDHQDDECLPPDIDIEVCKIGTSFVPDILDCWSYFCFTRLVSNRLSFSVPILIGIKLPTPRAYKLCTYSID